ncbi:MAG: threonine aldolase family protein [Candidatus Dormibacteria bacterium]
MREVDQLIDLRSDTVTRPSASMRQAMAAAEVGDDVFGEDPTVRALEERVAELLGKESALFCPSGTMSNLIAIAALTGRGDEVLVDSEAHILHYELAGAAVVAGVQLRNFDAPSAGCPSPAQLESLRRLADPTHEPNCTLLCLEQTHNRRGGSVAPLVELEAAQRQAHEMGLRVHLDGARLGNAAAYLGVRLGELAACADTVNFSLSKGLGCPAGSVWVGPRSVRAHAHLWRKRLGGGMRQVGVLAAAGLWALEHQLPRLIEDHDKARRLANGLAEIAGIAVDPPSVQTNIVLIQTVAPADAVLAAAESVGVQMVAFGRHTVRAVTHLDVTAAQIDEAVARLSGALPRG